MLRNAMTAYCGFIRNLIIIPFFIVLASAGLHAQTDLNPQDGTHLIIQLVTIGPGSDLTSFWGHNALIVEDTTNGLSYFYNYGLYSFDEDFVWNFVRGRLIFQVGAYRTQFAIPYYMEQNRDIRVQTLNLIPEERLEIAQKLEENIRPENREYLYHHYDDNCATRIRDLINHALDGKLKEYTDKPAPLTLRELTRRFTAHHYIWTWLLMFPMNDSIDKQITYWEYMFLPSEMEKILRGFHYMDQNREEKSLVTEEKVIFQATGEEEIPDSPPNYFWITLLIGIGISVIILLTAWLADKGKRLPFGFLNLIVGLFIGFLGMFLTLVSLFTDHTIAYHNENLFLTNPVSAAIPVLAIAFMLRKKWSERWLGYLWYFHLGMTALLLILRIFPPFDQDNSLALATFIPIYLAFSYSFFRYHFQKNEKNSV